MAPYSSSSLLTEISCSYVYRKRVWLDCRRPVGVSCSKSGLLCKLKEMLPSFIAAVFHPSLLLSSPFKLGGLLHRRSLFIQDLDNRAQIILALCVATVKLTNTIVNLFSFHTKLYRIFISCLEFRLRLSNA